MIIKDFSKCWLPKVNDLNWINKIKIMNLFIYFSKKNNLIKKEILYFINKKNINFTNNLYKANLLFILNNNLENEEYIINYKNNKIYIYSKNNNGFLYSIFNLFKLIQLNKIKKYKDFFINEKPSCVIRMINHLDNLSGYISNGYSGNSIFFLKNNINFNLKRILFYCRLLCSIGINYICINNSNVNLCSTYLIKKNLLIQLYEIYNIFYKYNIKMFISVNYKSPVILGNLDTFDPLNNNVINWWEKRIEKIYEYMPNLGGLVIETDNNKINNGPLYYGRNHAEGSKFISKALSYFNGILFWKCSIISKQNWKNYIDKACDIYNYFSKLDGFFHENTILQIKSGAMGGLQIREAISPLLLHIKETYKILELQINQEYTGQQIDICWLAFQWKYILNFKLSKNKKIKSLLFNNKKYYGMTTISDIGDSYYWTRNFLSQLNFFSYGKITWNININLNNLINEWIELCINNKKKVLINIKKIIFNSWKNYESYTAPLGTGWMVNKENKYDPDIDGYEYHNDGNYHYANRYSIGYNRKNFIKQYNIYNIKKFSDINKCPNELILFFHNLSYNFYLRKYKKILIHYIYDSHFNGVKNIYNWIKLLNKIKFLIKKEIYLNIKKNIFIQYNHACNWRDRINTYFFRKTCIKDNFNRKIYK